MTENIRKLMDDAFFKVENDWNDYKNRMLENDKEFIFKNSYNNAVAGEWKYFFDVTFENYIDEFKNDEDAETVFEMFLRLPNIIESPTEYVLLFDYVEFDQDGFGVKFEEFIEGECGVKFA